MKVNLHTHTHSCRHGSGNIADYMFWAEREKFDVLGFSEHVPLPGGLLGTTRIKMENLSFFWKEFDEAVDFFDWDRSRAWYMDIAGSDRDFIYAISKRNGCVFKKFINT